jgi:chemotaxis signal transduction protein
MRRRNKSRPKTSMSYLTNFMHGLHADRKRLEEIQSAYDNLTLLGQLLCAGTDITGMRADFNRLAGNLLDQLAREHHKKAILNLGSGARVAIDVLTRNLYERTADIGFLATDDELRAYAEAAELGSPVRRNAIWQARLQARFNEYARKYTVYHNIILLAPSGEVLVQLDAHAAVAQTADPLVQEALSTSEPYVEIFRPTDLLPGEASPLVYAYRVMSADGERPVGVLCLCFRFEDECRRIFESLVAEDDWTVITLLDGGGRVIASSDPNQFPVGARLEPVHDDECRVVRFAGREYLAATRESQGYQGYAGPGWVGHALAPLHHAFEMAEAHELEQVPDDFLACVLETANLFGPELKAIPVEAGGIQNELNRAVWNGYVWLVRNPGAAQNASFAKVLLREIGSTGVRTRNVFSESIVNLYKTVLSSVLFDCGTQAALAIDIMDRNLYERANDCRWWALNQVFREELADPRPEDKAQRQRLTEVLRRINGLYTVYSNLLLFDQGGRVLAVSNPAYNDWLGRTLDEPWVRPSLGLTDTQQYHVSSFAPSGLYDGQHTYIYSAAVHEPGGSEPVGGIAIVFDAAPQFRAMLQEVLPRQGNGEVVPGAFAAFADRHGKVIACSDEALVPGSSLMIGYEFFHLGRGESCANIVIFNGRYYAVGSTMSAGYREYLPPTDVVALVFSPLSETVIDAVALGDGGSASEEMHARYRGASADCVDIACFHIGHNWYGIRASDVIEAIDADRLTPMPGLPDSVCGCLMYDDAAITVLDLAGKLASRPGGGERRKRDAGGRRQVVILESVRLRMRFGILVDQIDRVCEVPAAHVEPLPNMMSDGNSLIEGLVKPRGDGGERRILMVLSVERILARLGNAVPEDNVVPLLIGEAAAPRCCATN